MIIRRADSLRDNFTIVPNELINDKRLSFEARGVLIYLLSKPPRWEVNLSNIAVQGGAWKGKPLGREKVKRLLDELIEHGYARRLQGREAESQRFCKVDYEVRDEPLTGFPAAA